MEFPEDLKGEITHYLDLPGSGLSRQSSRGWSRSRVWCNNDYIISVLSEPVTANEIRSLYSEVEVTKPIFVVTVGMSHSFRKSPPGTDVTLTVFDPSVLKLRSRTAQITSQDVMTTTSFNITDDMREGIGEIARLLEDRTQYFRSWADPYTSRLIMRRRLLNCDVEEPSLWSYFPENDPDHHSRITQVTYDMYVLGTASIHGLYNLNRFGDMYDYDPQAVKQNIIEPLKDQLRNIL